jgi:hypothetical protein
MAATVRSVSTATGNGTTGLSVSAPAGMASGDLLVAYQNGARGGSLTGLTGPSGWTLHGSHTIDADFDQHAKVWTNTGAGAGSGPWTFGFTSDIQGQTVALLAITGHDAADPFDVNVTFGGQATTLTSQAAPSMSPTTSDGLLLCCR